MRRMPVDQLRPGMIMGRTVVGFSGRALLTKDTMLTDTYIKRLAILGIGSVYIKDGLGDVDIPDIVAEETICAVSSNLSNTINRFSSNNSLDVNILKHSVNLLLDNLLANNNLLIQLEEIRTYSDHLFIHSINAAVLSIMTGLSLGYTEKKLAELGLGVILQDIGMIAINSGTMSDPQSLSELEEDQILSHPEIGFNILRTYDDISKTAAHIAYQHHEKLDGSGYPRGLKGDKILEYARIAAVADAFDNLTADRPDRPGCTATDALLKIKDKAGSHFDPVIVDAFSLNIAMYPVGSLVRLNTGHIAVVTGVTKINSEHPVINVVSDEDGGLIDQAYEIDLKVNREVFIVKRLNNKETDAFRDRIYSLNVGMGINAS